MNLLSGWSRKAVAALSAVEADLAAGEVSSIPCSLGKLFHSLFIRRQKRIPPKSQRFPQVAILSLPSDPRKPAM